MNASQVDDIVLARYLAGESDAAEAARVTAWLGLHQDHAAEFEDIRRAWALAHGEEAAVDTAAAWRAVSARIAPVAASGEKARHRRVNYPRLYSGSPWRLVAAAGIGALVLAVPLVREARARAEARVIAESRRDTTYYTAKPGQRAVVELGDGTKIVLAPASQLRYVHQHSGRGPRVAHLVGEAVFTVTHDAASPFLVYAKNGVTIDVGTRFGVRAYPEGPLRVAVAEGRVLLTDDVVPSAAAGDSTFASLRHATVLGAGDIATRTTDRTDTVTRGASVDALLAWEKGPFVFEHARFGSLLLDLERWYGLTVRVTEPALLAKKVSGQFEFESQDEVVRALATALGVQHRRVGTTVTFSPLPK